MTLNQYKSATCKNLQKTSCITALEEVIYTHGFSATAQTAPRVIRGKEIKMKATNIYLTAQSNMARKAADYINSLAMSNGFSTAMTADELSQYQSWFESQVSECDSYIAENLVIETEEIELDDEE